MRNSDNPLVSIGMPVYNGAKYIRQALDSLLAQDYDHFELILSDNASTDGTQGICLEYASRDQRIRYLSHTENRGAPWNFKHVLELASGEYFMWAAHDDSREPDAISLMVSTFLDRPDVIYVGSGMDISNHVTGELNQLIPPELSADKTPFENCVHLLGKPTPGLIYGMFRTEELRGTRFASLDYFDFGDLFLLYEISAMGRMQVVRKTLYHVGVVERVRTPKTFDKCRLPGFTFGYFKYCSESLALFRHSRAFSHNQRLQLIRLLLTQIRGFIAQHERRVLGKPGSLILAVFGHAINRLLGTAMRPDPTDTTMHLASYSAISEHWANQKRIRFYSQFISKGDLCFDIGANLGNRTGAFLELGARVVAVEPQKICVKALHKRFNANPGLEIIAKGVAAAEGEAEFWVCDETTTSSTMSETWKSAVAQSGRFKSFHWSSKISVQVTTLDSLIRRYGVPNFIKIDVEGFEYQVLQGLSRPIRFISFEFTYPEFLDDMRGCLQYLCLLGKPRFNVSFGESMVFDLSDWVSAQRVEETILSCGRQIEFGDIYARFDT